MNVSMGEDDVIAACAKAGVSVSASETLPEGGCHLVCTTSEGAETMRSKLGKHLITHQVKRFPFYKTFRGY